MKKILLTFFAVSLTIVSEYAASGLDTCIKPNDSFCADGYFISGECCYSCTQGHYCDGKYEAECPDEFPESDEGAKKERDCYKTCDVENIYMGYRGNLKSYYQGRECGADTTTITCVENAELNAEKTGCVCKKGFEPNLTSNTCDRLSVKITLMSNGYVFSPEKQEIYNNCYGFALTPDAESWSPTATTDLLLWWGQEFKGYYTSPDQNSGTKKIDVTKKVISDAVGTCPFKTDTTLYAHWIQKPYFIRYNYSKIESRNDECYLGVEYHTPSESAAEPGKYLAHWECTSGCSKNMSIIPGGTIPEPDAEPVTVAPQIILTAHWELCPENFYCKNGIPYQCPDGTVSDEGSIDIQDCFIGGESTVFQNSDGTSFSLPGKYYLIKQ